MSAYTVSGGYLDKNNTSGELSISFNLPANTIGYTVEGYVWDSFSTMRTVYNPQIKK
jgi:hypothetical protein